MSGGVDSSVAVALLKQQGYFVVGGYMKNFSPESWQGIIDSDCPWEQDVADVRAVCEKLGIECRSFNFEKEYREKVIDYFFDEYAAGRTPNPDAMCNKEIKFGLFLEKARELGFDYIATGHYVRKSKISPFVRSLRQKPNSKIEEYRLLKGVDPQKDQSYFLYTLTQEQLKHVLFPIGEHTKAQVRQMAKEFGLPNWNRKDSQGLCFVGHINLREFLKQRLPERVGEIVDSTGQVIGTHPGAWYYTIGQRRGLGIGGGTPYYVTQRDVVKNVIVVAEGKEDEQVYGKSAIVSDLHWISNPPNFPYSCTAKIRYQQPEQTCTISLTNADNTRTNTESQQLSAVSKSATVRVDFVESQFAIAPGQAIVFYDGDRVLGGGIIDRKPS